MAQYIISPKGNKLTIVADERGFRAVPAPTPPMTLRNRDAFTKQKFGEVAGNAEVNKIIRSGKASGNSSSVSKSSDKKVGTVKASGKYSVSKSSGKKVGTVKASGKTGTIRKTSSKK